MDGIQLDGVGDIPGVASSQMFRFYQCTVAAAADCNEENWRRLFAAQPGQAVQFVHCTLCCPWWWQMWPTLGHREIRNVFAISDNF